MLKGENINGYVVLQNFTTAGGGLSKWTFAQKGGKVYFLKEFLSPKYPTPDAPGSEKSKQRKLKECQKFEKHHQGLIQEVNEKCGIGGNLVFTVDFFRHKTKYYKVTEKIDVASLSVAEIASLPLAKRILILKTIAHSLNVLHNAQIVHGDLKPDNILIKRSKTGSYTAKLIDFDNSYFSEHPPEITEDVVGDMAFYSPELALYIKEDPAVTPDDLTTKSDIFALGLLYALYLTGKMPEFDHEAYTYAGIAAIADKQIVLTATDLPDKLNGLVTSMLQTNYHKRPGIGEVFNTLKTMDLGKETVATDKTTKKSSGLSLKGNLLAKKGTGGKEAPTPLLRKKPGATGEKTVGGLRGKGLSIRKKKD
ncbi:protein kinase [uncultured Microscilla sp.]|uniref:protein kinase domain-containing protein n=1 Tax=uncultured Microscilla sp. TaxID=432653 RepID=UPI002616CC69|nr:protein kinase [uncultured Microscilla sp.]